MDAPMAIPFPRSSSEATYPTSVSMPTTANMVPALPPTPNQALVRASVRVGGNSFTGGGGPALGRYTTPGVMPVVNM